MALYAILVTCMSLLAMTLASSALEQDCVVRGNPDFRPDAEDCSVFYVCANNKLYKFTCPSSVFDPKTSSCVPEGSIYDTCTRKDQAALKVLCLPGSRALIPHPRNCAQYYDCSAPAQGMRWDAHLQECPYPRVFNAMTKRCEHYSMVKCVKRIEPLSLCDYRRNQCEAAHCIPCNVRHPSCRTLPDGLNPWVGREGSPQFVVCLDKRVVYTGSCSQEHGTQIFDTVRKVCKEVQL